MTVWARRIGLGAMLLAASAPHLVARPAVQPDIAAQIVEFQEAGAPKMYVLRHDRRIAVSDYMPLYPGDQVFAPAPDDFATVELRADDTVKVTAANSPFLVPDTSATKTWSSSAFRRLLKLFPALFDAPHAARAEATTPLGWRGPSRGLPARHPMLQPVEQHLRSGERQTLLVLWNGDAPEASLLNEHGGVVAQSDAQSPGRSEIDCPALRPGRYSLRIGAGESALVIPVVASPAAQEPRDDDGDTIANIADALSAGKGDQLQALADLRRLSKTSYVAFALLRTVAPDGSN